MIDAAQMIPQPLTQGTLEYGEIPETSGVYLVFHAQECLYVGQSRNMRRRWHVHEQKAACRRVSPALTVAWIAAPVTELRRLERQAVEMFRPRFNRHLQSRLLPPREAVPPLLTVPEVAKRLQVTEKTVRAWIRDKELTAIRIGREWRLRDEDVETFLARRLSTATQEIHGSGD
jgi:excisionase family DNA binding protein